MTIIKAGTAETDVGQENSDLGAYTADLISDTGKLTQFGAFVETLPPGSRSSHLHWHSDEDEMIYVLSGNVTIFEGAGKTTLTPGDAACFKAGHPVGHCLANESDENVSYLVIGTRSGNDVVTYPGRNRRLIRKDGTRTWTDEAGHPKQGLEDETS